MQHRSPVSNPVVNRSATILSILGLLFLIALILFIHTGLKNGDLEKRFIQPLRDFYTDLNQPPVKSPDLESLPLASQLPSLSPTPKASISPKKPVAAPVAPCTRMNIREGEFSSNKCYSSQDYDDLVYYLNRFNNAVFTLNGANAAMKITCSGSEFFKQSCEEDTKEKQQAESDIGKYRETVKSIIAKGR